jgi:hypothetical protein
MSAQHLSDEAVAAFADGVLRGHARERAARHTEACPECSHAVRVQREAVWALRAAPAPALPLSLADRLRTLPHTTPITVLPTVVGDDGSTLLSTDVRSTGRQSMVAAPMAAFVPPQRARRERRLNPMVTTAAVVALTGALTLGAVAARNDNPVDPGPGTVVRQYLPAGDGPAPVIAPVSLFRGGH